MAPQSPKYVTAFWCHAFPWAGQGHVCVIYGGWHTLFWLVSELSTAFLGCHFPLRCLSLLPCGFPSLESTLTFHPSFLTKHNDSVVYSAEAVNHDCKPAAAGLFQPWPGHPIPYYHPNFLRSVLRSTKHEYPLLGQANSISNFILSRKVQP